MKKRGIIGLIICAVLIGLVGAGSFQDIENGENYTLPFRINLTSSQTDYYSLIDLDKSLILYMRMDDLNSSGHFVDLSNYGNNGTLIGSPVINSSNGYFGNGTRFNGVNQKILISDSNSLDSPGVSDEITICSWININSHGTGYKGIVGKWKLNERQYLLVKDSVTDKYGLLLSNNGVSHVSPNGASVLTDSTLNTNQWYHLCGTYNGSNIYVYLDSQKQSTTADSGGIYHVGSGNLEIGTFFDSFTYAFNGKIDEVLIFNRSLSHDEIKSLYNSSQYKFDYEFSNLSLGEHNLKGYDVNKSGSLNSTDLINFNIIEGEAEPPAPEELAISFVNPTPTEDVSGSSIYVNLSTNGSGTYSFVDFDSDLIAWYRMDDEDLGVLLDKSSYNNEGSFKDGAVTDSEGIFGRGLKVEDAGYVNIPDSNSLDSPGLTDEITICSWFKVAQHGVTYNGIVGKYDTLSGNNRQYLLSKNSADNKYGIFLSSSGASFDANVLTNSALDTNQWYHLCGTSDGTVKLYLDGVLQTQTATLAGGIFDNSAANLTIGKFGRLDSEFNGSIDEILIFKRALTEQEIKSLYNSSIYNSENNYTNLEDGSHTFKGYVVNTSANYLSTSRTILSGELNPLPPVLSLLSETNYENFFNLEYQISVTNNPNSCVYSRDGAENVTMIGLGGGNFLGSESLDAGIYNLTFYCTNDNGTGSLQEQFILRKSKTVEHTYFTNSEGLKIYFDFYFNYTSNQGPLLVVPDSWSSTKDSYRTPVMTAFRPSGYSVVLVDTRGKGSSEGTRGAFLEECIDIYEVINEVKTNPDYSSYIGENIYIWGFSAGGGRAGACSARYPDLFSGIFSTGGVLNVTKWWYLNSGYRSDLESRIGGTPATNPEGYWMRDASHLNYNALSPAMVTHYTGDASVNVELSRDYNSSMNTNEKEIRYDEYVGGSHAIVGLDDSIDYFAEHSEIYQIPESGDFILSGFLFTKNFTAKLEDRTKLGHLYYDISGTSKLFNVSTVSYNGSANLSIFDLSSSTDYSVSIDGASSILTSDSFGDLSFNFNVTNISIVVIIITPAGPYCGDAICNNGETCSSCPGDCGICSTPPSGDSGGSSGGGGGGGALPIDQSGKMEVSSLSDIIAHEGDKKTLSLNVKNIGRVFLNNCRLIIRGDISSWIYSSQKEGIAPGQNIDFNFDLNVPEEIEQKDYNGEIEIKCDEGNDIKNLSISVPGLSAIKVSQMKQNKNILNISYEFDSSKIIGEAVNVDIWLINEYGIEEKRITDSFSINEEGIINRGLEIDVEGLSGIYDIYFALSGDLDNFMRESVVLGKSGTTGFAILDSENGKLAIYFIFVIVICIGIFFIWKGREKKENSKSGKHKWLLRKKAAISAIFFIPLMILIGSRGFTGFAVNDSGLITRGIAGAVIFILIIISMILILRKKKYGGLTAKKYPSLKVLINKPVYTNEGELLGKIKKINLVEGRVENVIIDFNLKNKKKFNKKGMAAGYSIIDKVGDIVMLKEFENNSKENL